MCGKISLGLFMEFFLGHIPLFHKLFYLWCDPWYRLICNFFLRICACAFSNQSTIFWNLSTIRFGDSETGISLAPNSILLDRVRMLDRLGLLVCK